VSALATNFPGNKLWGLHVRGETTGKLAGPIVGLLRPLSPWDLACCRPGTPTGNRRDRGKPRHGLNGGDRLGVFQGGKAVDRSLEQLGGKAVSLQGSAQIGSGLALTDVGGEHPEQLTLFTLVVQHLAKGRTGRELSLLQNPSRRDPTLLPRARRASRSSPSTARSICLGEMLRCFSIFS
jgi:hypothetical protein